MTNYKILGIWIVLCSIFGGDVFANDPWKDRYWRGPHFYEMSTIKKKETKRVKPAQKPSVPIAPPKLSGTEWIERERGNILELMNSAIRNPTVKNVYAYRMKEKETIERAERYAYMARFVNLTYPETRLLKEDPADVAANQVETLQLDAAREDSVKKLAKTHGLLFFFSVHCKQCHSFAKVVKIFSEKYNFNVVPLSMEGEGLPEFPNAQDGQQMARLVQQQKKIQNDTAEFQVPALYAMDPNSKRVQIFPISHGNVSLDSLVTNIHFVERMLSQGAPVL